MKGAPRPAPPGAIHPPAFLTLPTRCAGPRVRASCGSTPRPNQTSSGHRPLSAARCRPSTAATSSPSAPRSTPNRPPTPPPPPPVSTSASTSTTKACTTHEGPGPVPDQEGRRHPARRLHHQPLRRRRPERLQRGRVRSRDPRLRTGAGCPNDSKIGNVEIETPLVEDMKVSAPSSSPSPTKTPTATSSPSTWSPATPNSASSSSRRSKVKPDPVTGQLTTDSRQPPPAALLPLRADFREGPRSPLVTPPACGTYTVAADLYP